MEENVIQFRTGNELEPVIEFKKNGDFYYKGKLIENDKRLYEAMVEFLKQAETYK